MQTLELEPLAWDSELMGFAVARVVVAPGAAAQLVALVARARAQGLHLVYLVLDPIDVQGGAAVEQAGGLLVDRKVRFQRPVGAWPHAIPSRTVQPATAWSQELEELAWQSGEYSRFRRDEHFAAHVFKNLYSHWLRASLSGELARAVWNCVDTDGLPTGLLTLQEEDGAATIGLLAVKSEMRGQGLGQALVQKALHTARQWQCAQLRVVTQLENERACRFYAYCGFVPERVEHIYHLWL